MITREESTMLDIKPKKIKAFSLTGRITSKVMMKAWKAVKQPHKAQLGSIPIPAGKSAG